MKQIDQLYGIPFACGSADEPLLLRSSYLQPGDVLLSSPHRDKASTAIRFATRGPFSHAALVLKESFVFESALDGVGYTSLYPVGTERDHRGGSFVVLRQIGLPGERYPPGIARIGVFRHRDFAPLPPSVREGAVKAIVDGELGLEYPDLVELRRAAGRFRFLPPVAWRLAQGRLGRPPALVPGSFCSQVIAKFFTSIGLPLFERPVSTERVGPNDIARSHHLYFVDAAVAVLDSRQETHPELVKSLQALGGLQRNLVRSLSSGKRTLAKTHSFLALLEDARNRNSKSDGA